jgi:hypothetical protein
MKRVLFAVLVAGLCWGSLARADTLSITNPLGDLGSSSKTFNLSGIAVGITGFNGGNLFAKNQGSTEMGLGLAGDPSGEHEIFGGSFIQVDWLNLIAAGYTNFQFAMNSTEGSEIWQVTACSTAGVAGSGPCTANAQTLTGTNQTLNAAPSNLSATNHFLDFSIAPGAAASANVLLAELMATPPTSTPEPASLLLLGAGLATLAGVRRRGLAIKT